MKPLTEKPTDVSAEREYAQRLAHRLLCGAANALLTGETVSLQVTPPSDPLFAAVAAQGLQVIAEAVRRDQLPMGFIREVTQQDLSASTDVDIKNGPGETTPEAITTHLYKEINDEH